MKWVIWFGVMPIRWPNAAKNLPAGRLTNREYSETPFEDFWFKANCASDAEIRDIPVLTWAKKRPDSPSVPNCA